MSGTAEEGERWPFDWGMEGRGRAAFVLSRAFCRRARVLGERLRARARFSREESDEGDSGSESGSGASEMVEGEGCFVEGRVMGVK